MKITNELTTVENINTDYQTQTLIVENHRNNKFVVLKIKDHELIFEASELISAIKNACNHGFLTL